MAEITAALVKALRDKTDAGMMDCKKALNECNGDMDAAVKYLREKGIAKAAAKADRDAKEGVIRAAVAPCGCSGIILELNCETDFCAKGDKFQGLVNDVAKALMDSKAATLEEALQVAMPEGTTEEYIKAMCSSIGENMALRKFARLTADGAGAVVSYIHGRQGGRSPVH
jgi:elongation factor Ts